MTVLVAGGGITGLVTAWCLGRAGVETILVEASDRLGGKVRTERIDGYLVEHGPDALLTFRPAALELARELGLGDSIVGSGEPRTVLVRVGGRSVALPDGMGMVLPTRIRPLLTTRLLTPAQKLRAGLDLLLPRTLGPADVGIGPFVERRLGRGVAERLAGPLLGGVYGTSITELSLQAVMPALGQAEGRHRSLILASLAAGRERRGGGSPFVTLAGGLGSLVDALADAIGRLPTVRLRTGCGLASVERRGGRTIVRLADGELVRPDALVLATPAPVTARLLEPVAPAPARVLREIPYGSTGVVTLAYGTGQFPAPVTSHGILVADSEGLAISAATISSNKFAGRAPDGAVLVRAFLGDRSAALLRSADGSLVAAARRDVETLLGARGEPRLVRVSRFVDQVPHYTVGHVERVDTVLRGLEAMPDIVLTGSAYRGVGVPDCVTQGRAAARAVLEGEAAPATIGPALQARPVAAASA